MRQRIRFNSRHYEGSVRSIIDLFLVPFMDALSINDEFVMTEGVSRFFSAKTRYVYFAKVLSPFVMPGSEWIDESPVNLREGKNPRITKGTAAVVRWDDLEPNKVEIEIHERVYRMNDAAWKQIESCLELVC